MNYRIEKKEAFRIVGVSCPLDKDLEKNFAVVPQMWGKVATDGTMERIAALMDGEPQGMLGVSDAGSQGDWEYYIAVAKKED